MDVRHGCCVKPKQFLYCRHKQVIFEHAQKMVQLSYLPLRRQTARFLASLATRSCWLRSLLLLWHPSTKHQTPVPMIIVDPLA